MPAVGDARKDFTSTPSVPITVQRPLPVDLDKHMKNPGAGRATRAVTKEKPNGSEESDDRFTVLQQHVLFWDPDKDGLIQPWDTYNGFHALGFHPILAFISIFVIHGTFSYFTQDGWLPSPTFAIKIKNSHRMRHGSDTQVYDSEGRFVPEKFEEIFTKFDKGDKGGLSAWEMVEMGNAGRKIMDPVGWSAFAFEWWSTWYIAANEDGWVPKESLRGIYDGTFFYKCAAQNEANRAKARKIRATKRYA